MRKTPTLPQRQGFTLIEIMIVVGIIAMLMAFAFPVVNTLREKAKETQCGNNMKQWMSAMIQYTDEPENRSTLPGDGLDTSATGQNTAWYNVLPPYLGLPTFKEQVEAKKVPAPGIGKSLFICPSYVSDKTFPFDNVDYAYSYGMNFWVNAEKETTEFSKHMRLSQMKSAAQFVVFSETLDYKKKTVALYPSGANTSAPAFRHKSRVLCGFADGHIEPVNEKAAQKLQWNPHYEPGMEPPGK